MYIDWSSQRWIPLPPLISDGDERGHSSMIESAALVVLRNNYEKMDEEQLKAGS